MARTKTDADIQEFPVTELVEKNTAEIKTAVDASDMANVIVADKLKINSLINQRIGRKQISGAIQKLVTVTDLVDIKAIKEAKIYKGFQYFDGQKLVTITTFEQYCEIVEGRSREAIDVDLRNFNQFGEEFFDAMRTIGIGPATMRDYRKLPDDEKEALFEVAQNGDKDSFVELATALISKHEKEQAAVNKKLDKLTEDLVSKDLVISSKTTELNKKTELVMTLERRQLAVEQAKKGVMEDLRNEIEEVDMPGEMQLMGLQEFTRGLTVSISATLNSAIAKLYKEYGNTPPKHIELAARQALGLIITATYGVAENMGIAPQLDVDTAAEDPAKADAEEFLAWQAQQSGE